MKINMCPENTTAEITFKIKKPMAPNVTYRVEAEITECSPPRVMVSGKIVGAEKDSRGDVVFAEAIAKVHACRCPCPVPMPRVDTWRARTLTRMPFVRRWP